MLEESYTSFALSLLILDYSLLILIIGWLPRCMVFTAGTELSCSVLMAKTCRYLESSVRCSDSAAHREVANADNGEVFPRHCWCCDIHKQPPALSRQLQIHASAITSACQENDLVQYFISILVCLLDFEDFCQML